VSVEVNTERTLANLPYFFDMILTFPWALSPNQHWMLTEFMDGRYDELLMAIGRKGGKSDITAGMALHPIYRLLVMYENPQQFFGLMPDEPIYVIVVSVSRDQALGVMFEKIKALAKGSWFLREYLENVTREELRFTKNLVVRCQASSSRSGRGYATIMNVYDELAWFMDSRAKMSGEEVYSSLQPNLKPFRDEGKSICISSPAGRQGIFWELFKTGKPISVMQKTPEHGQEPWRAVFQFPTWEMNPLITYDDLEKDRIRDPIKFDMEYGALFSDVIDAAVLRKFIDNCARGTQMEANATDKDTPRLITLDPAVTGDAYALAMMHMNDKEVVIVDLIKYWLGNKKRPIRIADVEDEVRNLCKRFNIYNVVLDQQQSASTAQRLQEEGIPTQIVNVGGKTNMVMYNTLIPRINMGTIQYPKHPRLIKELTFLQRKKRGRYFKIEAAYGHNDDGADCLAMGCYILELDANAREMWGGGFVK